MLNEGSLDQKVIGASKWSFLTEIASKLMPPIVNMVLARLLTPAAFGMVATVTMITSFAEIFADAGFQKYLVQNDFESKEELDRSTDVAFWTNLVISLIMWGGIVLVRDPLATTVGNPGLGSAIAISAAALPLISLSSIQMARYRREFDFRTLFFIRLVSIFIPIFITIPLAFLLRSFWALIIGTLVVQFSNAVLATVRSKWKPHFFYSIKKLKEMLSFSIWLLIERLLGWANLNVGIFLVGRYLSDYYLGVYKTSMAYVNQVIGIVISAFSPVLLSTLSRNKGDEENFKKTFYQFEHNISIIVLPLGFGIFAYRELFTNILLGKQWVEAINFIGFWALLRSLQIVFGMFSMEVFVAKGKPLFSVIEQVLTLIVLIPTLFITAKMGYEILYIARCLVVLWSIVEELILLKIGAGISAIKIMKNCYPYLLVSIAMYWLGFFMLRISNNFIWQLLSAFVCIIFYLGILCIFPKTRKKVISLFNMIMKKGKV